MSSSDKIVEMLQGTAWVVVPFEGLRIGNVFRDVGDAQKKEWRVTKDPTPCEPPGNYQLEAVPYSERGAQSSE